MDIYSQYEKIGKDYVSGQKEFFSRQEDDAIKFIKNSLPELKDKKVLDIGCGNGKDMKLFESLGAAEVYGIDTSAFMLGEAKQTVLNPQNLFQASIEGTPFEDDFFDVIVGRYSLHYLKDFDVAYNELSRILKKDGLLILVVHHPFGDLISQESKIYGEQEIIKVELYDNKVPIHFPTHTMKNYFSKTFFDKFYLVGFEEAQSPERIADEFKSPIMMGIKAMKR